MQYLQDFESEFELFCSELEPVIKSLVEKIGSHVDELEELRFDQLDELKGYLAAGAANDCSDSEQEQYDAIVEAEEWVTDNLSNATLESDLAVILWLNGNEPGTTLVYHELGMEI